MSEDIGKQIRKWYADLPEITLPNTMSEDGSHLTINEYELIQFCKRIALESRIDEVEGFKKNRKSYLKTTQSYMQPPKYDRAVPAFTMDNRVADLKSQLQNLDNSKEGDS